MFTISFPLTLVGQFTKRNKENEHLPLHPLVLLFLVFFDKQHKILKIFSFDASKPLASGFR